MVPAGLCPFGVPDSRRRMGHVRVERSRSAILGSHHRQCADDAPRSQELCDFGGTLPDWTFVCHGIWRHEGPDLAIYDMARSASRHVGACRCGVVRQCPARKEQMIPEAAARCLENGVAWTACMFRRSRRLWPWQIETVNRGFGNNSKGIGLSEEAHELGSAA